MSINLTDEIEVKTKKGKLGAAKQIFLEGDTLTVEKEIQDINSRHNDLSSKHESLSSTVSEHTNQIESNQSQITANKSTQDEKNASLDANIANLNTRDDQITELVRGITATGGASVATAVSYDNTYSQLASATVQGAVDELQDSKIDKTSISHEIGEAEDRVMSQKIVSSKFSDLQKNIDKVNSTVNGADDTTELDGTITSGSSLYPVTLTSTETSLKNQLSSRCGYFTYSVEEGKTYSIESYLNYLNHANVRMIIIANADGKGIAFSDSSLLDTRNNPYVLTIPEGGKTLYVNGANESGVTFESKHDYIKVAKITKTTGITQELTSLNSRIEDVEKNTTTSDGKTLQDVSNMAIVSKLKIDGSVEETKIEGELTSGKNIYSINNSSGSNVSDVLSSRCGYMTINVSEGETYKIESYLNYLAHEKVRMYVIVDENRKTITSADSSQTDTRNNPIIVTIPANGKTLYVNGANESGVTFESKHDYLKITRVEKIALGLEDKMNNALDSLNDTKAAVSENSEKLSNISLDSVRYIDFLKRQSYYLDHKRIESAKMLFRSYVYSLKFESELKNVIVSFDIGDSHDSTLTSDSNGNFYCVYVKTNGGSDNATNSKAQVVLKVFNISNPTIVETYVVAENGTTIGSKNITLGAGQPNLYLIGTELHIIFTTCVGSSIYNNGTIASCVFNTSTKVLSNYSECIFTSGENTFTFNWKDVSTGIDNVVNVSGRTNVLAQMNSSIGYYNDEYYASAVFQDASKPLIFKTSDFVNWSLVKCVNDIPCNSMCECAIYVDANGIIYAAIRQAIDNLKWSGISFPSDYGFYNGLIVAKYDQSNLKWIDYVIIPDCGSRPCFFTHNDNLYLVNSIQSRASGYIIQISKDSLSRSGIVRECVQSNNFQYNSVTEYNGLLYNAMSRNNGIEISKFSLDNYIAVDDKIKEIMGI